MGTGAVICAYPYVLGQDERVSRVWPFTHRTGQRTKFMKQPILVLTLALGLSAGLTAGAYADQSQPASTQIQTQSAQMPSQPARSDDDPYRASLTRSLASPYDFADVYTNSEGFPLPGWAHMNNTK
jgi:hypothetical protein